MTDLLPKHERYQFN